MWCTLSLWVSFQASITKKREIISKIENWSWNRVENGRTGKTTRTGNTRTWNTRGGNDWGGNEMLRKKGETERIKKKKTESETINYRKEVMFKRVCQKSARIGKRKV